MNNMTQIIELSAILIDVSASSAAVSLIVMTELQECPSTRFAVFAVNRPSKSIR
jgi:hypothetical protein